MICFKTLVLGTLAFTFSWGVLAKAQENGPYKVLKIQLVGGDGGFEYVAADPDGRNLYGALDVAIGNGCDGATFNPETTEAFSSQNDGTLTVIKEISPTDSSVEQIVATLQRAKPRTLDPKTGRVLLITTEYGPLRTAPARAAAPLRPGAPAWMRGPRPPMIPGSFQILVVGE